MTQTELQTTHPDTVYHLTGIKRIGEILTKGLWPDAERGRSEGWRRLERFVDDERPESIIAMGISRRGAVFAHPDINPINNPNSMGAYKATKHEGDRSIALAVTIDNPDKVLVCDSWLLGDIDHYLTEGNIEQAQKGAQEYWKQAVTLKDFRKYYESAYTPWVALHARGDDAPRDLQLPNVFSQPEVLIPGEVAAEQLQWAASSTVQPKVRAR